MLKDLKQKSKKISLPVMKQDETTELESRINFWLDAKGIFLSDPSIKEKQTVQKNTLILQNLESEDSDSQEKDIMIKLEKKLTIKEVKISPLLQRRQKFQSI